MPKKFLRRVLPSRETIERIPISRRFTNRLNRPGLWDVAREPVALGLAVGVLCGMIPGPLQMIAAVTLACLLRVNLPMALIGTFLTNPITIVPIYMLAYGIGQSLSGAADWHELPAMPQTDWTQLIESLQAWSAWMASLGTPWLLGMLVLSLSLAVMSYCWVQLIWRGCRFWSLHCLRVQRRNRIEQINKAIM
jgi:uncharacterized protein (DUF2062 family)